MSSYTCIKCSKEFKYKSYYNKHLLRKTPCITQSSTPENTIVSSSVKKIYNDKIYRLNYIGSKYQLLEWLATSILEKTGYSSFENINIADIFAGTGVVSNYFRHKGSIIVSNDVELYSSIITRAFTTSIYNKVCQNTLSLLNEELDEKKYIHTEGFITIHYSPYKENKRMFFTVDNARRIDYLRLRLEELKTELTENDYYFILATIITSSDAVSNVPAVYGCYLKKFKEKALKKMTLIPVHLNDKEANTNSMTYNMDVLSSEFLSAFKTDIAYLDPPYNERQYSKNYFPLNIIAKTPKELENEPPLKGKTGIPQDCFISPFCKKNGAVERSFETLISDLSAKWVFISYNSESLISKEKMNEILSKYGELSIIEREYKRFKSFDYNKDVEIKEYLFCLHKT